jgi:hypothetical protein
MTDRTYRIVSPTAETITLDPTGAGPYVLDNASQGIGWPSRIHNYVDSVGDGGTSRGSRYGIRPLDLTIYTIGSSRSDLDSKLEVLARVIDPQTGQSKLTCETGGLTWELPFDYSSGLEASGSDRGLTTSMSTVALMAPEPFWVSTTVTTSSVSLSGSTTLTNSGDVSAPVKWQLSGANGVVDVRVNGEGFDFDATGASGQTFTFEKPKGRVRVTNGSGVNQYALLGAAPRFPSLRPGANSVTASSTGGGTLTASFFARRRAMY